MAEVKRISIRHDAIMDFIMANPTMPLREVADAFGITQAWLSTVIHSDAFQSRLSDKQEVAFHHTVLPLREKMNVVAGMALDRLIEELPAEKDVSTINRVASKTLESLGFGSKVGQTQGGNVTSFTQVNITMLENARKLIGVVKDANIPQLKDLTDGIREAQKISTVGEDSVGTPYWEPSLPPPPPEE